MNSNLPRNSTAVGHYWCDNMTILVESWFSKDRCLVSQRGMVILPINPSENRVIPGFICIFFSLPFSVYSTNKWMIYSKRCRYPPSYPHALPPALHLKPQLARGAQEGLKNRERKKVLLEKSQTIEIIPFLSAVIGGRDEEARL